MYSRSIFLRVRNYLNDTLALVYTSKVSLHYWHLDLFLFLRPLVMDKKNSVQEAISRLLWRDDITRCDWLLVYISWEFSSWSAFFKKLVKLFSVTYIYIYIHCIYWAFRARNSQNGPLKSWSRFKLACNLVPWVFSQFDVFSGNEKTGLLRLLIGQNEFVLDSRDDVISTNTVNCLL